MKKLLALGAITVASCGAAHAQIGCELGGGLGYSMAIAATTGLDGLGLHSTQPDAQIRGECGYKFQSNPLYVGLYGEYEWKNVQFGLGSFTASLGDGYGLGGRVGLMTGNAMPYVSGGYVHRDLNWSVSSPSLPNSVDGFKFGAGVEFAPFKNFKYITLSPEVTYTDYSSITVGRTTLKDKELAGMLRVNVALFAPGQAPAIMAAPLK